MNQKYSVTKVNKFFLWLGLFWLAMLLFGLFWFYLAYSAGPGGIGAAMIAIPALVGSVVLFGALPPSYFLSLAIATRLRVTGKSHRIAITCSALTAAFVALLFAYHWRIFSTGLIETQRYTANSFDRDMFEEIFYAISLGALLGLLITTVTWMFKLSSARGRLVLVLPPILMFITLIFVHPHVPSSTERHLEQIGIAVYLPNSGDWYYNDEAFCDGKSRTRPKRINLLKPKLDVVEYNQLSAELCANKEDVRIVSYDMININEFKAQGDLTLSGETPKCGTPPYFDKPGSFQECRLYLTTARGRQVYVDEPKSSEYDGWQHAYLQMGDTYILITLQVRSNKFDHDLVINNHALETFVDSLEPVSTEQLLKGFMIKD